MFYSYIKDKTDKIKSHSEACIFVGYPKGTMIWKILQCKFYYSQAHESLYRKWLVHPWGWSHKELDQYDWVEFLTQIKTINKKKTQNAEK